MEAHLSKGPPIKAASLVHVMQTVIIRSNQVTISEKMNHCRVGKVAIQHY